MSGDESVGAEPVQDGTSQAWSAYDPAYTEAFVGAEVRPPPVVPQTGGEIRLCLATAELLLQGALAALLAGVRDMRVVALASDASSLVEQLQSVQPAVAVVDIGLPRLSSLSGLAKLRAACPASRILTLVYGPQTIDVGRVVECDVDGVLRTNVSPELFVHAIRRVSRGEPVIDHDLAAAALRRRCPLTPREIAVLTMVSEGLPVPDIAARLHLSGGTVRNHVSAILAKSGARNRVDAIRIAYQRGWLPGTGPAIAN